MNIFTTQRVQTQAFLGFPLILNHEFRWVSVFFFKFVDLPQSGHCTFYQPMLKANITSTAFTLILLSAMIAQLTMPTSFTSLLLLSMLTKISRHMIYNRASIYDYCKDDYLTLYIYVFAYHVHAEQYYSSISITLLVPMLRQICISTTCTSTCVFSMLATTHILLHIMHNDTSVLHAHNNVYIHNV